MSFRLARMRVLTRSSRPIEFLLSQLLQMKNASPGEQSARRDEGKAYELLGVTGGIAFGALSPISRIFPSSSDISMPESASKSAGTCAAILVMSPVSL